MDFFKEFLESVNAFMWGPPMLVMLSATGLFLTLGLKLLPIRKIGYGFQSLWQGRQSDGAGDISAFNALMTSLSATIGTGNIAGVATALAIGGPGALFWMWCIALVGMATKYSEAVLAVRFRETNEVGEYVGGPMYYIKNGLGDNWKWLAAIFAFLGMITGFGMGNTVQANSVADMLLAEFGLPLWVTGAILTILVALVLLGGIKRIAEVAGKLVPFMAIAYLLAGLVVLIWHADRVPGAIEDIFYYAFNPAAASGGFAGAAVLLAIRMGIARGIFSNEAGIGSAPIAHAAAQTKHPVKQGVIAMLGTFIDTLVICSVTGLVIMVSGVWTSGENGAPLTAMAFEQLLPGVGSYIVSLGLPIFAFTTILGWSFYGEKCTEYLLGHRFVIPFRLLWVLAIPLGAMAQLDFIWLLADTLNAMMAVPNLIALLLLSPVVFKLSQEYFAESKALHERNA